MAIKPPNWCKDALPSPGGWRHAKTGELLVSGSLSPASIREYMGIEEEVVIEPEEEVQQLNEAPPNNKSLNEMSKVELETLGREHGVELDRRKNKKTLVQHLKEVIN
tara:strand:- start:2437 stop:2757 length:321 start_codon:yes stop_codon:yes gene_type:complete